MKFALSTVALLAFASNSAMAQNDGDAICVEGYIMDRFCIERGTLFDNRNVKTLEGPGEHSVHCLVDVPPCYNSPFHVLEDPAEEGGTYGEGWSVTDNQLLLDLARSVGDVDRGCTTCDGMGDMVKGFRAAVRGVIDSAADKTIRIEEVSTDASLCDEPDAVVCTMDAMECPDGSFVGRVGPDCEFEECPVMAYNETMIDCSDYQHEMEVPGLDNVMLHYVVNHHSMNDTSYGTISVRVEYSGEGWIGFAVSPEGVMAGSDAIIGIPSEEGTMETGDVSMYHLPGYSYELLGEEMQTLMDAYIMQDENGTVLEFTRMLEEDGQVAIDGSGMNYFLIAHGSSNTLGYHGATKTSFALNLTYCEDMMMMGDMNMTMGDEDSEEEENEMGPGMDTEVERSGPADEKGEETNEEPAEAATFDATSAAMSMKTLGLGALFSLAALVL